VRAETASLPFNRKYLGSKRLLRAWIAERIVAAAGAPATFLDGFCGTGAVGFALAEQCGAQVTAVDSLRSNCVILRGCAAAAEPVEALLDELNALPAREGYIVQSYADTYFTRENCARMDAARERIEELRARGALTPGQHDLLLASFLLAADRVANTLGQYDAFMKNIGPQSMVAGRHVMDGRVQTTFRLTPLAPFPGPTPRVVEGDIVELLSSLAADVAYFDPPYNHRQYCDNYHVLENLARWEKPPLFGATRKFDRTGLRSAFSRRAEADGALRRLIAGVRSRHVFLSYSSEGILSREAVLSILAAQGTVRCEETPYPVFGNGAGVAARRNVTEYLFHLDQGGTR
jgi:adenine-specific DNA-methyltransferase